MKTHHLKSVLAGTLALLIASSILALVIVSLGVQTAPAKAQDVTAYQTVTLLQATAITQPLTATGVYLAAYGVADCYSMIGANTANTATVYLQHGPNISKWVDLYAFGAALANSISFTHTALYGNYTRAWVALASTAPITLVVQCIAKNIQQ